MNKAQARQIARERVAAMRDAERADAAQTAARALIDSGLLRGCVLAYLSLPSEMDTQPLLDACLARGCTVYVPVVRGETMRFVRYARDCEMRAGAYGIREPIGAESDAVQIAADVCVTPMAAVDAHGNRAGKGKGYYDRYFAVAPPCVRIGYGYDAQVVDAIDDVGAHDVPMQYLATECGCRELR